MLVPPASAFGNFVGDISLFRLIVVVEVPWQVCDGTEREDKQEESTLGGPASDKTREKILDVFQNYLSAREHGSTKRGRMRDLGQDAIDGSRYQGVISS